MPNTKSFMMAEADLQQELSLRIIAGIVGLSFRPALRAILALAIQNTKSFMTARAVSGWALYWNATARIAVSIFLRREHWQQVSFALTDQNMKSFTMGRE